VLVGPGDGKTQALHLGDELLTDRVCKKRRLGYEEDQMAITKVDNDYVWMDGAVWEHKAKILRNDIPGHGPCTLELYVYRIGKPRAVYFNLHFVWEFLFGSTRRAYLCRWLDRFILKKSRNRGRSFRAVSKTKKT
jgi:hypothetical protein